MFYDKILSVKTSNVLVTDRFIEMLEDTLDVLEELTDKLKVETDPARYRELRVSESRESLIDSVLIPVRIYLKGPFCPLDESEKNLLSKFAEYCDAIRHFVLYELTNHIPGSEMPDKIEGLLDKTFGIMRKTMFEPKEPKCDAVFEELRNCFNAASEEMRIRIRQGLDRSNAVIVSGFTEKAAFELETIALTTANKTIEQMPKVVEPISEGMKKQSRAINNQAKAFDNLRREFRGENDSPHEMSKSNKFVVNEAIVVRRRLIKEGVSERNATTDACREVEAKYGIGKYASFEAFRDAVNTKIKNQAHSHGIKECLV